MAHIFPCCSESKDSAESQQKVVVAEENLGTIQFADYMKSSPIFMLAIEQKRSILGRPELSIPAPVPHAPKPYFGMHLRDRNALFRHGPRGFSPIMELGVQRRFAGCDKGFGFSGNNARNC
ncbi:MAG: hypothetical protein WA294_01470 [Acidobacteriaceae bacterium]